MRNDVKEVSGDRYYGVVLKDLDPLNQGRYKVYIETLMGQCKSDQGIWCKNRVSRQRSTTFGSYTPIVAGTNVIVIFQNNDLNNGLIVDIAEDHALDNTPHNIKMDDRDKVYVVMSTEGAEHVFTMVNSGAKSAPENSIHIYGCGNTTKIIINSTGIHISSPHIGITTSGSVDIKSNSVNIEASTFNVKGGTINLDGTINLSGSIQSSKITGLITSAEYSDFSPYAAVASGLGGGGGKSKVVGSPASASGNPGYNAPAEITNPITQIKKKVK